MIDALASMVNAQIEAVFRGHNARTAELTGEIERLERQASYLVRFLATGGDSPAVRAELRTIETTLEGLRAEWRQSRRHRRSCHRGCTQRGSCPNWNGWMSRCGGILSAPRSRSWSISTETW